MFKSLILRLSISNLFIPIQENNLKLKHNNIYNIFLQKPNATKRTMNKNINKNEKYILIEDFNNYSDKNLDYFSNITKK
jgi:hypothetical protein